MKKLLFMLPVILLAAAGCNSYTTTQPTTGVPPTPQQQVAQNSTPTPTPTHTTTVTNKTYTNSSYGISFSYPSTWQISSPEAGSGNAANYHFPQKAGGLSDSLVITNVSMPNSSYPNTNFRAASATVAVDNAINDSGVCLQIPNNNPGANNASLNTGTVSYNNVIYSTGAFTGAGAGTVVTTSIYHAEYNGRCYEVNLNVATGERPQVKAVQQILDQLAIVVKTLKFGAQ